MSAWEDKLNSIVNEADSNIDRIQGRLETARGRSLTSIEEPTPTITPSSPYSALSVGVPKRSTLKSNAAIKTSSNLSQLSGVWPEERHKKEIEQLKAKIITLEHTVAVISEEATQIALKQERMQENMCELTGSSRSNYKELAVQLLHQQQTITQLQAELSSVKKKKEHESSPASKEMSSPSDQTQRTSPSHHSILSHTSAPESTALSDSSCSPPSFSNHSLPFLPSSSALRHGYVPKMDSFDSTRVDLDTGSDSDLGFLHAAIDSDDDTDDDLECLKNLSLSSGSSIDLDNISP